MATQYRPLTHWPTNKPPTPHLSRVGGPFRTTLDKSMRLLDVELQRIAATDVVVQVDLPASKLRKDGRPFGDARPATPSAVLTFTTAKQRAPVTIACDRFVSFAANLHAIMLTLHDLRRIDRYGTAASGEQYRGWAALPATTTTAMNAEQAAEFLEKHSKYDALLILTRVDTARDAWRRASNTLHPENGGRSGDFALATDAARVLAARHGVEKL